MIGAKNADSQMMTVPQARLSELREESVRTPITKDLLSGILFIAFGLGTTVVASHYKIGDAMRVGPGTFPIILGIIVALIGLAVMVRAIRNPETSEKIGRASCRERVCPYV